MICDQEIKMFSPRRRLQEVRRQWFPVWEISWNILILNTSEDRSFQWKYFISRPMKCISTYLDFPKIFVDMKIPSAVGHVCEKRIFVPHNALLQLPPNFHQMCIVGGEIALSCHLYCTFRVFIANGYRDVFDN